MPREKGLTPSVLARESLTGGQIKNALLQAARFAVSEDGDKVKKTHFKKAIERIHKSKGLMGKRDSSRFRAGGMSVGSSVDKVKTDTGKVVIKKKVATASEEE